MPRVRRSPVWYNLPGVVASYQFIGAPSYLRMLFNLTGSNVYTLSSVAYPSWTPQGGAIFNGSQYLNTGYVNPSTQQQSMLVRFSGFAGTSDAYLAGSGNSNGRYFGLSTALGAVNRVICLSGYAMATAPGQAAGVLGVSLNRGYLNGVDVSAYNIADWASSNALSVYIGARNGGSLISPITASIQAMMMTNRALNPAEMALASHQMAYCEFNPAWNAWAPKRRWFMTPPPPPPAVTAEDRRAAAVAGGYFGATVAAAARGGLFAGRRAGAAVGASSAARLAGAPGSGHDGDKRPAAPAGGHDG